MNHAVTPSASGRRPRRPDRRIRHRRLAILCLAATAFPGASRATAGSEGLPPADAIDLEASVAAALDLNPAVRAARLRHQALLERQDQRSALPDPMFSYSYMFEDVVTANGPVMRTVELSQEVPFHRKRPLRAEVSLREAEAAEEAWRAARLDVIYAVRAAYYDLFRIDRSIAIVEDEATVLDRLEQVARGRYAAGIVSQEDVLRAQTERSMIEERLLTLRREREAAAARFNEALDRPQSDPVGRAVDPPDQAGDLPPDERLFAIAREQRPEVAEARSLADAGRAMESLARRDSYPDFRVGVQWNEVGETANPFAPDPGQDAYMLTIGVSIPLWRSKITAGVREAQAITASAHSEVRARGNRAESDVRAVLAGVRAQRDLVSLYDTTLAPQAESTLEASEAAYVAGKTDFLAVLDSERRLLAIRLGQAVTLGELGKAVASLERAVGRDLDELRAMGAGEPVESEGSR